MRQIYFLGGTFDPPHLGHLKLARAAVENFGPDEFLIVPDHIPPHKDAEGLAPDADRLEMCRLTFTDPIFTVSDIDLGREGRSYSVDLVRLLAEEYPGDRLWFVMASDMLLSFDRWYRWKEILRYCGIAGFTREKAIDNEDLNEYADRVLRPWGEVKLGVVDPLELSSTEVRAAAAAGESLVGLVAPEVEAYIREKGLYGAPEEVRDEDP